MVVSHKETVAFTTGIAGASEGAWRGHVAENSREFIVFGCSFSYDPLFIRPESQLSTKLRVNTRGSLNRRALPREYFHRFYPPSTAINIPRFFPKLYAKDFLPSSSFFTSSRFTDFFTTLSSFPFTLVDDKYSILFQVTREGFLYLFH